jgi:hypothetical protein
MRTATEATASVTRGRTAGTIATGSGARIRAVGPITTVRAAHMAATRTAGRATGGPTGVPTARQRGLRQAAPIADASPARVLSDAPNGRRDTTGQSATRRRWLPRVRRRRLHRRLRPLPGQAQRRPQATAATGTTAHQVTRTGTALPHTRRDLHAAAPTGAVTARRRPATGTSAPKARTEGPFRDRTVEALRARAARIAVRQSGPGLG